MRASAHTFISASRSENGVGRLVVPEWSGFDWLWHGFSMRGGGVSRVYIADDGGAGELNLSFTAADAAENVRENRLRWIEAVTGSRETPLRTVRQIHSCVSTRADEASADVVPEADGLMTARPGMLLGIQTADCIPVLVVDPEKRVVAGFHAGWRGTVERIVELGIAKMRSEFGSDPSQLVAAIGPGIGSCCYTVGEEVQGRFRANFSYAEALFSAGVAPGDFGSTMRLDLTEANRRQLLAAGLPEGHITTVGGCTSCQPESFYSHRASGGHAGRMMASIGIRS